MSEYIETCDYPGCVGECVNTGRHMEKKVEKVEAEFKIGKNKDRPRIWLDGKRLTEAGFVGGTAYYTNVWLGNIVCALEAPPLFRRVRKVTGRLSGKPIIDMLGSDVEEAFPGAERVKVTFEPGKITIRRA